MRAKVTEPTPQARETTQKTLAYNALYYASEQISLLLRNQEEESGRSYVAGAASHEKFARLIIETLKYYDNAIALARVPKRHPVIEKCLKTIEQLSVELKRRVVDPLNTAKLKNDRQAKKAIQQAIPPVMKLRRLASRALDKNRAFLVSQPK